MRRRSLIFCLATLALPWAVAHAQGEFTTAASWIWFPERPAVEGADKTRYLRRVVRIAAPPAAATLRVLADDGVTFTINGAPPPKATSAGRAGAVYDLSKTLRAGENVMAFAVYNSGGPGGLIVSGSIREPDGAEQQILSDASFRASREAPAGWDRPGFDDSRWPAASIVGSAFAQPWYGHPAFDMEPFFAPGEKARHAQWREQLIALPPGLDKEQPTTARLGYVNGNAALTLNGEVVPALIYRGTVDPLTLHGRRQLALFRDAGVHAYCAYWPLAQCWPAPDRFDFSELDAYVRAYLSVDPQAHVMLILRLVPPNWWLDSHPQDMVGYAAGPDFNSTDESGRVRTASYASVAWRTDMMALWRRAVEHLEAQPWGKRVIGYHPGYGIYTEWHYFGSWTNQMPDTGSAMTAHFRDWLLQRYGTVERLRDQWAQPDASFATATVPGVAPRLAGDALGLRDPAKRRWVMDYYRCQQELTADCIEDFCRAAKQATGGRVVCGAFYGYFHGVHPQTQGGHLCLERLLKSPWIDYFAAPYDYSNRLTGQDGRLRCLPQVFAAAGKVHMIEADTRTYLHGTEEYGRTPDAKSSIAAIRREVATALTTPSALWWCDFGADGSGGWYDDPKLIGEVAALVKLAQARLNRPRLPVAQVAVVCDLESMYSLPDAEAMRTHLQLLESTAAELYHTGTPFDEVLLSQLSEGIPDRYRLLIFLDTLQVSPETRKRLAGQLAAGAGSGRSEGPHAQRPQSGREASGPPSVLWLWAPGISDGRQLTPDLTRELTGFKVALRGNGLPVAGVRAEKDDPLTADLPQSRSATLHVERTAPVAAALDARKWYNPRDAATMKEQYSAFDWAVRDGALRWHFATTYPWTDIHLEAAIPPCDGLAFTLCGEGSAKGASLRAVIKDADSNEFVAPRVSIPGDPQRLAFALGAFERAPWRTQAADHPRLPLSGMKLVLDGLTVGEGTLVLSGLEAAWGTVQTLTRRGYDNPAGSHPCLVVEDPAAKALGVDPQSGEVVLAARGTAPARQVLCTVPFVPRQVLAALMQEAGVRRVVDSPDVVVRADSGLIALHTAKLGPVTVHLPGAVEVRDALTGRALGHGPQLSLDLPGPSTTLLELAGVQ